MAVDDVNIKEHRGTIDQVLKGLDKREAVLGLRELLRERLFALRHDSVEKRFLWEKDIMTADAFFYLPIEDRDDIIETRLIPSAHRALYHILGCDALTGFRAEYLVAKTYGFTNKTIPISGFAGKYGNHCGLFRVNGDEEVEHGMTERGILIYADHESVVRWLKNADETIGEMEFKVDFPPLPDISRIYFPRVYFLRLKAFDGDICVDMVDPREEGIFLSMNSKVNAQGRQIEYMARDMHRRLENMRATEPITEATVFNMIRRYHEEF